MKLRMLSVMFAYALVACSHDEPAKDPSTTGSTMTTHADGTTDGTMVHNDGTTTTAGTATETPVTTNTTTPSTTTTTTTPATTTATTTTATTTTATTPPPPAGTANRAPDNTTVNDRDRGGNTATPMTQGNSDSEVKITAAIRRSVMGDSSLGFNAKNVKIITVGTKVTLRGPVANDHERSAIEAYAKAASGVTAVDNQLEVKK